MKKFLLLFVFLGILGFKPLSAQENHHHYMGVHGWVTDLFTQTPAAHQWIYYKSNDSNASPSQDSALTNSFGHYHLDSIDCQEDSILDIDVYSYDCHHNKISYHLEFYYPYIVLNFNICTGQLGFCHAEWNWTTNPIDNMQVQFHDNSQGNINKWLWDFGDGTSSNQTNPTHIYDSAGTYHVSLQVMDTLSQPPCYDVESKNVTLIHVNKYNLAGQVFAGSFPHPNGEAIIYYQTPGGFILLDSCELNVNGVYAFYQIPEGNYFIQVSKVSTGNPAMTYWPTYLGNTITWQHSQVLYLQGDNFQGDINLQTMLPTSSGPGKISGTAYWNHPGNNIPADNVEIMLANESGAFLTYVYTDGNGDYEFSQLPYGNYRLHAEIAGSFIQSIVVTIDASQPEANDVTLFTNNSTIGIEENNLLNEASMVYPNPNNGLAHFDINVKKATTIDLTISDILGTQLRYKSIELLSGKNTIDLPLEEFKSGTYLINVSDRNNMSIRKKFELIK